MKWLTFLYDFQVVDIVRQGDVFDVDRVPVVRPWADLQRTQLLVEREELDVDRTQTFVDRRRLPHHQTVRVDCCFRHQFYCEVAVGTAHPATCRRYTESESFRESTHMLLLPQHHKERQEKKSGERNVKRQQVFIGNEVHKDIHPKAEIKDHFKAKVWGYRALHTSVYEVFPFPNNAMKIHAIIQSKKIVNVNMDKLICIMHVNTKYFEGNACLLMQDQGQGFRWEDRGGRRKQRWMETSGVWTRLLV